MSTGTKLDKRRVDVLVMGCPIGSEGWSRQPCLTEHNSAVGPMSNNADIRYCTRELKIGKRRVGGRQWMGERIRGAGYARGLVACVLALGCVEHAEAQDPAQDPEVLAAVSEAMSNPISSLIILQTQYQFTQYKPPTNWTPPAGVVYPSDGEWGFQFQFIPTVPAPLGSKINLISRLGVPILGAPISSELGDLVAMSSASDNLVWDALPTIADPTQRTWGLGDLWYLGLVAPRAPIKAGSGTLLVAAGPTLMMPTASEGVLGQGKWSGGAGGLFGWTSPKGMFAVLGMQFWSFAGDENRADVSLMSLQAFYYYNFNAKWSVEPPRWHSSTGSPAVATRRPFLLASG